MVVFSKEFGSLDPFSDAVLTAIGMIGQDVLEFNPHIGIASGTTVVGYVGTPIKYNCSVFGSAVTLAARCANAKPGNESEMEDTWNWASVVFPASDWGNREIDDIIPRQKYERPSGRSSSKIRNGSCFPLEPIP